ncbi:hypothetical protein NGRA_3387 [Nosema granulosis]|uniref:Peptidase A2 domain-containing protein n=1 Tax=Nosema granulosis TaxID=83296 RepID=A0A9P6KXQ9_9MICR|nr:hypothetical protein NGRA_3387 [Nosema granulosis]
MLSRVENVCRHQQYYGRNENRRQEPQRRFNTNSGYMGINRGWNKTGDKNYQGISRWNGKRCTIHGPGTHNTWECERATEVLNKERSRIGRRVNQIETGMDDDQEEENKGYLYYFNRVEMEGNPFFITGTINGRTRRVLIDTGADVSLIDIKDLESKEERLETYRGLVRAAGGEILKILGKKRNCNIMLDEEMINFSPLVMESCKYIILGADVIKDRPHLLTSITNSLKKNGENKVHRISEENIKDEFSDIFKTEIGELNLCTAGKHKIITTSKTPICERNGRIPISQENIINEEIEKNLRF